MILNYLFLCLRRLLSNGDYYLVFYMFCVCGDVYMRLNSLYLLVCFVLSIGLFCSCSLVSRSVVPACKISTLCVGASLSGRWILVTTAGMIMSAVLGFFLGRKLLR
jgi:hypothetical protein